jgi:hypothetical protein
MAVMTRQGEIHTKWIRPLHIFSEATHAMENVRVDTYLVLGGPQTPWVVVYSVVHCPGDADPDTDEGCVFTRY